MTCMRRTREKDTALKVWRRTDSRALWPPPLADAGGLVPVAGAFVLVAVGARRHAMTVHAAHAAVFEAAVHHTGLGAPHLAFAPTEC